MKAAIFDMDGTLIDSMGTWGEICTMPLDKYNISYPDDILNIVTPMGLANVGKYYNTLGLNLAPEEIYNMIVERLIEEYRYRIPAKPFVKEYLDKLKSEGVKMCILTASAREYSIPCLERLGILDYFEFFMSCDEAGLPKTNPEIFKKMAEKLGASIEETAVFDDNLGAVTSAKASGACVYGVYDKTSEKQKEEIIKICDKYVISFENLL